MLERFRGLKNLYSEKFDVYHGNSIETKNEMEYSKGYKPTRYGIQLRRAVKIYENTILPTFEVNIMRDLFEDGVK